MKTLYRRWLVVGLSLAIFALNGLKKALEDAIEGDVKSREKVQAIPDSDGKGAAVLPMPDTRPISATTVILSGTVIRNGTRFALRETAGVLYTLDSTGRAWPFEGEDVRVTGHFDSATSLLHVEDIEGMAS
jgi:Protein of unknown function (DUF5818)